jgi:HD-GYP domain-containing protein (c-di-GMP phosphodiesterase class II)
MVRFSDIIKIKDKEGEGGKTLQRERYAREDKFRLSDSQIFQTKEKEPIDASPENKPGLEIVTYYEKFIERAMDVRERVKADKGISPSPILSDLHYIIEQNLVDKLYEYAMSAHEDYEEMIVHTIDVTFTALKVGKGMDYDVKMFLRLGLAAFLENVGMYKIPESILKSRGKLGQEEVTLIKKHPELSRDILGQMGERYKWLADVAYQIHERYDGSGYPLGLKGDEISELASIIGLVDTYSAMIKNRPYRKRFIQTDSIKSIVGVSKGQFPPKIVKVFLNQISLFPVNSYIRLNNRSVGRVISTDKKQPLRPTIELLYDGSGNRLEKPQIIRLSENPLLYIDGNAKLDSLHKHKADIQDRHDGKDLS